MTTRAPAHAAQHGFSLLEMMVAIVIGMFSVLVIMQVLSSTATSRRIAVGGGDAQLNGLAALRALELDVEHAGMGLQSFNISGCALSYSTSTDGASVTLPALAPVVIDPPTSLVPAGDSNTDTLLVTTGSSGSPNEGDGLTATTTATSYVVTTPASYAVGDYVIAAPSTRSTTGCALGVAQVTAVSGYTLTVSNGTSGLATGSILYNIGRTPTVRAYAIRNSDLLVCNYVAYNCGSTSYTSTLDNTVWVPVASNIVSLRAQYGRDTSGITGSTSVMDGVVDRYDQTTPATSDAIAVYCGWARIVGVRMAIVSRSQQYDKTLLYSDTSTSSAALTLPTWAGSTANTATTSTLTTLNPTAVPITLTGYANYNRYRYNTLQTMIPIRNAIWQGAQPTYQGGSGAC